MKPLVAIVGRPNVGKSTLFNRLVGRRIAIVEAVPGVTRDRIFADTTWQGRTFTLVDTGGLEFRRDNEVITEATRLQAAVAVEQADVICFVVDIRQGIQPDDREIAQLLRRSGRPVVVAANKAESPKDRELVYEFYGLGLGEPVAVSAEHGTATGDLLDQLVSHLPETGDGEEADEEEEAIHVALVGRPNVGKSSLINKLTGQERAIVSDVPGTTRDAIDILWEHEGTRFRFVDTAGMRRKARVKESLEYYSVLRTLRAVDRADVVVVLLDATELVAEQDQKIAGYAHNNGKASILLINKWDLVEKDERTMDHYLEEVRYALKFVDYAPALFISALTGQRIHRLPELIRQVYENQQRRIGTGALNRVLEEAMALHEPPSDKGRRLRLYYATQVRISPPSFVFFVNDPELVHYSYRRYLENRLRQAFSFDGSPIRLIFRQREH